MNRESSNPEEMEELIKSATNDLEPLTTKQEIKDWWQKYLRLGHRRLGRILIGRPPSKKESQ